MPQVELLPSAALGVIHLICFAILRCVPWQECFDGCRFGEVGGIGCFHEPCQVAVWVEAVFNRRLDQAEGHGAAGCSTGGIGKQEVLPVNDERLYASGSIPNSV